MSMQVIKNTRAITYRRAGVPAVILEGLWLEKMYGWKIGSEVDVEFQPKEIRIKTKELPEGSPIA